jgi:micrococcal nuclease
MRQFVVCTLFLLCFPCMALASEPNKTDAPPPVVKTVLDGDTFVTQDGTIVRLAGIDAPETGKKDRPEQRYAATSRSVLEEMVLGKQVAVIPAGKGRDRFGRVVAIVKLEDKTNVNLEMVKQGAAFCYWFSDSPKHYMRQVLGAQRLAMVGQKGFWPMLLKLEAAREKWIGNRNTRRACPESFKNARRMSSEHRALFNTMREAFWRGYAPARDCTPWPEEDD